MDYGFFEGDELLQKGFLLVTEKELKETHGVLSIKHKLLQEMAEITIEAFTETERHIKSTLHIPIHESGDWESIELAQFTLAFKCILDA